MIKVKKCIDAIFILLKKNIYPEGIVSNLFARASGRRLFSHGRSTTMKPRQKLMYSA